MVHWCIFVSVDAVRAKASQVIPRTCALLAAIYQHVKVNYGPINFLPFKYYYGCFHFFNTFQRTRRYYFVSEIWKYKHEHFCALFLLFTLWRSWNWMSQWDIQFGYVCLSFSSRIMEEIKGKLHNLYYSSAIFTQKRLW